MSSVFRSISPQDAVPRRGVSSLSKRDDGTPFGKYASEAVIAHKECYGADKFDLGEWIGVLRRCDTLNLTMYMSA